MGEASGADTCCVLRGPLWEGVNDTEWQGGKNISPCGNLTSLTTILPEIGGIQMNHGWSPHDGMGAPSCGALMME